MRRMLLALSTTAALVVGSAPAASAAPPPLPDSMAAVGDSITRGFNAGGLLCFLRDCTQHSWTTGTSTSVDSHYERLLRATPLIRGRAANDARTGAKMADLARQLGAVAGRDVDYVTVLVGANDVCTSSPATMTPVATFESQFRSALTGFLATEPDTQVFVASIPNVHQLWSVLRTRASGTWRSLGICQSMLATSNTDAVRQQVLAHLRSLNDVLAAVCTTTPRCHWDGGAVFGTAFTVADVSSTDWFHPSPAGQAKLATVTWERARAIWGL